jgi:hypothetical protein
MRQLAGVSPCLLSVANLASISSQCNRVKGDSASRYEIRRGTKTKRNTPFSVGLNRYLTFEKIKDAENRTVCVRMHLPACSMSGREQSRNQLNSRVPFYYTGLYVKNKAALPSKYYIIKTNRHHGGNLKFHTF